MNMQGLFKTVEARLHADLAEARAAVAHAPSKGAANEQAAKAFLKSRLPRTLDVSSGFLIDTNGGVSKQLDIIVYDAAKTPVLFESGDNRVIPIECAYAVIEVKTDLTLAALDLCVANMKSVKSLKKIAFYDEGAIVTPTQAYGREYKDWPLMYFIFAFDSAPLSSIAKRLNDSLGSSPIDMKIDCVYSLQRGCIANKDAGGIGATPTPTSKLIAIESDALLAFYTLIAQYFNQTYMRKFRFSDYLKGVKLGVTPLE